MNDSLELQSQRLMRRLSATAQPVRDEQYVHVSERAMSAPSVVGFRRDEAEPFTGWEIVATNEFAEEAKFGYYSVKELAAQRPAWLVGLQLPTRWACRFVGNTLIDCVSPEGTTHSLSLPVEVP